MSVEFRVGRIFPPETEPKHSIYGDLVDLPDPLKLGLTVRIYNYDGVTLYMRVDGYASGWTFTTNDFGALTSGSNFYQHIDQFGSRAKPAAETTESITVRLRAYTDAGYTTLKWTYEKVVDVVLIKSDDGSWTTDFLNNFDDGTVQGWAAQAILNLSGCWIEVRTDYVLSPAYSVRLRDEVSTVPGAGTGRLYKSFTTPNKNIIYAIINVRPAVWNTDRVNGVDIRQGSTILTYVGKPAVDANVLPLNRWLRFVVPLTKNVTQEISIYLYSYSSVRWNAYLYLDDFKIISKD